jgi:hypothetical protein
MILLPSEYPGPEQATAICTALKLAGLTVPRLREKLYHENEPFWQAQYWSSFRDYVIAEAGGMYGNSP